MKSHLSRYLPSQPPRQCSGKGRRERGMVLLFALLLMLVAMIAALAVARTGFASIAGARHERERLLAHGAAEAALRDAERDIAGAGPPARAAMFAPGAAPAWPSGCGQGAADRGLCAQTNPPAWQALDLAAPGNPALVPYGGVTGAPIGTGGLLPARAPVYLIERLAPGAQPGALYRITAIGFGAQASMLVVLQALYRTPAAPSAPPAPAPAPAGPAGAADDQNDDGDHDGSGGASPAAPSQSSPLPAGRIGAREIVNWRQLHAQAQP
ncbi:pilus assembly protein [Massilia sp. 9096]|uniref:pilus assembly PilX family protein n=1 Tax=Massilia sp. 9096 TaxID=1500894 RepID=UPI0006924408|nr:pilus assembly protein [Massilia sp. 9096]